MSNDSISSPSTQSQHDNPLPEVQHGVIMNELWPIKMVDGHAKTVLTFCFLDGTVNQKKAVCTIILKAERDGAKKEAEEAQEAKRRASPRGRSSTRSKTRGKGWSHSRSKSRGRRDPVPKDFEFATWEDCANIEFQETGRPRPGDPLPDIRITFEGGMWSTAIGTDGRSWKPDSMSLNGLKNQYPPDVTDRGNILHELGHALGLEHEHQGPSTEHLNPSGEKCLDLDEKKIKEHYAKTEFPEDWVKLNIIDRIKKDEGLRNYTNLDLKSIMIYDIFDDWQKQRDTIRVQRNVELSEVDMACIKLMYPPDLTFKEDQDSLMDAMVKAGVNPRTASNVLNNFFTTKGEMNVRLM